MEQQLFKGVEEAVLTRLAQCCQAEDVLKGQIIQSSGQKAQDLLILRQGHAQQQGQLSEQGEQASSCCLISFQEAMESPCLALSPAWD